MGPKRTREQVSQGETRWPQDTSGQGAAGSRTSHSDKRQLKDIVRNLGGDPTRVQMSYQKLRDPGSL